MRTERFLVLSGEDRVRSDFGNDIAHVRARLRTCAMCPMRCARRIGLDRGDPGGDLCRCAVGIGGGRVVSDTLCC